jgi:hypothetical protein
MSQVGFFLLLYAAGLLFGLLFKKRAPFAFLCASSLLWGALGYVLLVALALVLGLPVRGFVPPAGLALIAGLAVVNGARGNFQLARAELSWLGGVLAGLVFVLLAASRFNFSSATYDSFTQILMGRSMGLDGLTQDVRMVLSSWGIFVPALQSASVIIGVDYLSLASPAFAYALLLLFPYLTWRALPHARGQFGAALLLALAGALLLFTSDFMVFLAFYIHTNLIAGAFLFTAIAAFWLARKEQEQAWLVFGIAGLIGFSLTRAEAPLFTVLFLVAILSTGRISRRGQIRFILPFLGGISAWLLYLAYINPAGGVILNPVKILVIVSMLLGLGALVLLSRLSWVERLRRILPYGMLAFLGLGLAFMFLTKPGLMWENVVAILKNLFVSGRWGATWVVACLLATFAAFQPQIEDEIFFTSLPAYFLLVLSLGYMRFPYESQWYGSANRILAHVLPVVLFYLLVKLGAGPLERYARAAGEVGEHSARAESLRKS